MTRKRKKMSLRIKMEEREKLQVVGARRRRKRRKRVRRKRKVVGLPVNCRALDCWGGIPITTSNMDKHSNPLSL